MNLIVLTPGKQIFHGEVKALKVPGVSGQFEILKNHAPLVSALSEGNVRITAADGEQKLFKIEQGFVEVLRNEISLLVTGVTE